MRDLHLLALNGAVRVHDAIAERFLSPEYTALLAHTPFHHRNSDMSSNDDDCNSEASYSDASCSEASCSDASENAFDYSFMNADDNESDYEIDLSSGNYSSDILKILGKSDEEVQAKKAETANTDWKPPAATGLGNSTRLVQDADSIMLDASSKPVIAIDSAGSTAPPTAAATPTPTLVLTAKIVPPVKSAVAVQMEVSDSSSDEYDSSDEDSCDEEWNSDDEYDASEGFGFLSNLIEGGLQTSNISASLLAAIAGDDVAVQQKVSFEHVHTYAIATVQHETFVRLRCLTSR
jgi:hypothetical protein